MIGAAAGVTIGTATLAWIEAENDGYGWTSPEMAAIKTVSLGMAGSIGGIFGASIVAPAFVGFPPVAAALIFGAAAVKVVDNIWDNIEARVALARVLDITDPAEIADFVIDSLMTDINGLLDQTGQAAIDFIESLPDYASILWDSLSAGVNILGDWLTDAAAKFGEAITRGSPLVLDLDGDGIELVAASSADAVYWQYTMDDFAKAGGWVTGGDGFLTIDLNDNGIIDNAGEMFGDQTGYANGFLALRQLDSNADGYITAEDASFNDLRIWIDSSMDGYSQADELHTLSELLITSINLSYSDVNTTNAGNKIYQTGTFTINGNSRTVADVYFAYDSKNTVFSGDYTLDLDVLALPTQRGYGTIPDLHIAMSLDNTGTGNLLDLVSDFNDITISNLFTDDATTLALVTDILYRWAGVDGLTGDERGEYIDSRKLGFLEALMGQDYLQQGAWPNPFIMAGLDLEEAFHIALANLSARLMAQGAGGALFAGNWHYNLATDSFEGVTGLDTDVLSDLATLAGTMTNKDVFWQNVVRMVEMSVGTDNLLTADYNAFESAINGTDSSLHLDDLVDSLAFAAPSGSTYNGTTGNDTLAGGVGNDVINGDYGNDILSGGLGADTIYGGPGNDTLKGEGGADLLRGGSGDDVYEYSLGQGTDTIIEDSGNDTILFGAGIDSGDLTMTRVGAYDLSIVIDTGTATGWVVVEDFFWPGGAIETIEFDDTSTIDLTTINWTMTGTSGNDTLYGVQYGGGADDTINGGAGNDTIYGYDGANTLNGGDGNDTITGGAGVDTVDGGAGDDVIYGHGGNDVLSGGAGNDRAEGGIGDDSYIYTSGHDTYAESGGTDTIVLPAAYSQANTTYYKIGGDLKIVFGTDGANDILIKGHYYSGGSIETLDFDSGTDVNLTTVSTITQGDENNNTIYGTANNDVLYGNGGNDLLTGENGNDMLYGGTGNDTLYGGYGDDLLDGGAGNDMLDGWTGTNTLVYTSGHDTINNALGTDSLVLNGVWTLGDVTFARYNATPYHLKIAIDGANSITVNNQFYSGYAVETITDGTDSITFANHVIATYGAAGNDTIYGIGTGGSTHDVLYGLDGNDTMYGGAGNDTLYGGAGNDALQGSVGDDLYYYEAGDDTINEQSQGGADELRFLEGVALEDLTFYRTGSYNLKFEVAGAGSITILNQFYTSSSAVEILRFHDNSTFNLLTQSYITHGTASAETINGITVSGSVNDIIYAHGGNDAVNGYEGNDILYGGDGNDVLNGGNGNDTLNGEAGNDTLRGGAGDDIFVYSGGLDIFEEASGTDILRMTGSVTINDISIANAAGTNTLLTVNAGTDEITINYLRHWNSIYHIDRIEFSDGFSTSLPDYASWIWGTSGADTLTGTSGDDTIIGRDGNDTLDGAGGADDIHGGAGNDTTTGGAGNDLLHGGEGDDTLYGGDGLDTLYGGAGADVFVFEAASAYNNVDVIRDFSLSDNDAIDLADILGSYDPMSDAITDFVQMTTSGSNSTLFVDRDGLGGTYGFTQIATITGVTGLTDEAALVTGGHLIVA